MKMITNIVYYCAEEFSASKASALNFLFLNQKNSRFFYEHTHVYDNLLDRFPIIMQRNFQIKENGTIYYYEEKFSNIKETDK